MSYARWFNQGKHVQLWLIFEVSILDVISAKYHANKCYQMAVTLYNMQKIEKGGLLVYKNMNQNTIFRFKAASKYPIL